MTSTKTTTTPATVDTEESATRVGPMHQAFADFLNGQHGANGITAEQVFLVTSKRKAFRSTDTYRVEVKAAQEQAKAADLAAKEQRAQERAADRQRKAEEKAAAAAAAKAKADAEKVAAKAPEPAPVEKKAPAAKAPAAKPAPKKAAAAKANPAKTA
ncbi:hypothetical protein [Blastococcus sp. CT_GayMR16]|uniref:hypothetical protein n=1 Tax=Blastococcus sp. CT_GayMR16 TaxID=2559607 RepID=UPI00107353E2|nr:hypothetical protein [Blastococcus sp. CT_GayMR16]TFV89592.1 hypothetical protein E4P38_07480 [Blastococcus sp. CT_GayMR16]